MLSILPNLRTLTVDVDVYHAPLQYMKLLAHYATLHAPATESISLSLAGKEGQYTVQNAFAILKEIRMYCSSLDYDETLPILDLPSLRTFYTYGLSSSRWNWEPPAASSGVWHLRLDGCEMNEDELFWMLRACREPSEPLNMNGTNLAGVKRTMMNGTTALT